MWFSLLTVCWLRDLGISVLVFGYFIYVRDLFVFLLGCVEGREVGVRILV